MKLRHLLLSLGVVLGCLPPVASAQNPTSSNEQAKTPASPTSNVAKTKADAEAGAAEAAAEVTRLQQRGVSIIREAANDSVNLDDKRLTSRVQTRAASASWKFDRDSARELFAKAFDTALAYYRETKDTNLVRRPNGPQVSIPDARQDVIRALSKLDPALAKTMTERLIEEKTREIAENLAKQPAEVSGGTDPAAKGPAREGGVLGKPDPLGEELFGLAFSLLEIDRDASVNLARRAFANSIVPNAAAYFVALANVDRRAADQLYIFALARLGAQDPPVPGQLMVLSAYPFGDQGILISDGTSNSGYGFGKPRDFAIDPALIKAFFARAVDVLTRTSQLNVTQFPELMTRVNSGLFAARYLEAKVAQYEPALVERWGAIIAALYTPATEASRNGVARQMENSAREQKMGLVPEGEDRIKNLLDSAEKMTDFVRKDETYAQAAQAVSRTDVTRALGIADKITDMEFRQNVRDWLNFNASSTALGSRKLEEAKRYALEVSVIEQRAYLLFQIAAILIKARDRAPAIDLLEEATRSALAADTSADKLRALLGICNVYAAIDPTRAFEIGGEAVKTAGGVKDYALETATLHRSLKRKGSTSANYSSTGVEGFDIGKTLSALARADLERALNLAQSIENRPLRLLTVVDVATTFLEPK